MWSWVAPPNHRRGDFLIPIGPRARYCTGPRIPEAYDAVIGTYKNWYMALGESGL